MRVIEYIFGLFAFLGICTHPALAINIGGGTGPSAVSLATAIETDGQIIDPNPTSGPEFLIYNVPGVVMVASPNASPSGAGAAAVIYNHEKTPTNLDTGLKGLLSTDKATKKAARNVMKKTKDLIGIIGAVNVNGRFYLYAAAAKQFKNLVKSKCNNKGVPGAYACTQYEPGLYMAEFDGVGGKNEFANKLLVMQGVGKIASHISTSPNSPDIHIVAAANTASNSALAAVYHGQTLYKVFKILDVRAFLTKLAPHLGGEGYTHFVNLN